MKLLTKIGISRLYFFGSVVLLVIAIYLRFYNYQNWFEFNFDQETLAWIVKTILVDHKVSLIGLPTSAGGIFIGPYFNYLLAFFYWLGKMDPAKTILLNIGISMATDLGLFFVGYKIFGKRTAFFAALIYAFSAYLANFDRVVWPPMLMPISSIVLFYTLWKYLKTSSTKYLILATSAVGFMIHLHFSAVFAIAVYFCILILLADKKKLFNLPNTISIAVVFGISLFPLIIFDVRHNYLNFKNFLGYLTNGPGSSGLVSRASLSDKASALGFSFINIVITEKPGIYDTILAIPLVAYLISLPRFFQGPNSLAHKMLIIFLGIPIGMLLVSKSPYLPYYLLFAYPIFILALGNVLRELLCLSPVIPAVFISIFLFMNAPRLVLKNNYLSLSYKRQAVDFVVNDAKSDTFRVDFIHAPGMKTGFVYLFWLDGITNLITDPSVSTKHVYKIVVPSFLVAKNELVATFGDFGVVKDF